MIEGLVERGIDVWLVADDMVRSFGRIGEASPRAGVRGAYAVLVIENPSSRSGGPPGIPVMTGVGVGEVNDFMWRCMDSWSRSSPLVRVELKADCVFRTPKSSVVEMNADPFRGRLSSGRRDVDDFRRRGDMGLSRAARVLECSSETSGARILSWKISTGSARLRGDRSSRAQGPCVGRTQMSPSILGEEAFETELR